MLATDWDAENSGLYRRGTGVAMEEGEIMECLGLLGGWQLFCMASRAGSEKRPDHRPGWDQGHLSEGHWAIAAGAQTTWL